MPDGTSFDSRHPLRKLFREAIDFGMEHHPSKKVEAVHYVEEQILCGFLHSGNLYRIRDGDGRGLEDIADMLAEGNVLLNAQSFAKEYQVHKHIGDYTLFMLGMFPNAFAGRKGREFILGKLVIPRASLSEHYILQGQRSYEIASEFTDGDIFTELSANFSLYRRIIEFVRIYLESRERGERLKIEDMTGGDN